MSRIVFVVVLLSAFLAFIVTPVAAGPSDPVVSNNGDHDIPQLHVSDQDWLGGEEDATHGFTPEGQRGPYDLGSEIIGAESWSAFLVRLWVWLEGF